MVLRPGKPPKYFKEIKKNKKIKKLPSPSLRHWAVQGCACWPQAAGYWLGSLVGWTGLAACWLNTNSIMLQEQHIDFPKEFICFTRAASLECSNRYFSLCH